MASLCVLIFALIGFNTTKIPEIFQVLTVLCFASLTFMNTTLSFALLLFFLSVAQPSPKSNQTSSHSIKEINGHAHRRKDSEQSGEFCTYNMQMNCKSCDFNCKIFLTSISSFCDSIYVTDIYSVFHLHLPGYVNQLFSDQLPVGLQAQY